MSKKFVPYEKMSKKERKKLDSAKRRDWNGVNPVTRVLDKNSKKYSRKIKHKNSRPESIGRLFDYYFILIDGHSPLYGGKNG